jgi:carbonic anhydrase
MNNLLHSIVVLPFAFGLNKTTYNYLKRGNDWGSITGFEKCDNGKQQSPINFVDWSTTESETLSLDLLPDTYLDDKQAKIDK